MGSEGAGDGEFLLDVFYEEPFEVEEGPTSQTLNGLKPTFPTSCWRQIASFPVLKPVSCFWAAAVDPGSFSFRCGWSKQCQLN